MSDSESILVKLLGDYSAAAFLEENYLRLPFSRPEGASGLTRLGTWPVIERILIAPGADVIVGREGRRWDGTGSPTPAEARELVGQGFTIGIRHAQRQDADLAQLADEFQKDFHAPIDVHLYCTPAGQPGFGWHYDAEEVFILQTQGEKEWRLRKNTVNPWPLVETIPANQQYEREIMPMLSCKLAAGDWLYIPGGYWHRTEAGAESISLSVGVLAATALDVFDFLRSRLLQSLEWRQRLPVLSETGNSDVADRLREMLRGLGDCLSQEFRKEEFIRAFLAERKRQQDRE